MSIKQSLITSLSIIVCSTALIVTFWTIIDLTLFLSDLNINKPPVNNRKETWITISWSLLIDQALLSIFILQHSLLALDGVKNLITKLKLPILQRSIYVICTTSALQLLIKNWRFVPDVTIWSINVDNKLYWWTFVTFHAFAWSIIYFGTIFMDPTELLGVKQVYYSIRQFSDPITYKSYELQRLLAHIRHPSFIGFLIILWVVPILSLDRVLLATILSSYMYLAWNTDEQDHQYQNLQYVRKFHELNYVR